MTENQLICNVNELHRPSSNKANIRAATTTSAKYRHSFTDSNIRQLAELYILNLKLPPKLNYAKSVCDSWRSCYIVKITYAGITLDPIMLTIRRAIAGLLCESSQKSTS